MRESERCGNKIERNTLYVAAGLKDLISRENAKFLKLYYNNNIQPRSILQAKTIYEKCINVTDIPFSLNFLTDFLLTNKSNFHTSTPLTDFHPTINALSTYISNPLNPYYNTS